jgi:hypothetical protein
MIPFFSSRQKWPRMLRMATLRQRLRKVFYRQSCLLIGSAPNPTFPPPFDYSRCVCVNGSPFVAHEQGVPVDLTVFGGWSITQREDVQKKSWYKLRNLQSLSTDILLYCAVSSSHTKAKKVFNEFNFRYNSFLSIDTDDRRQIVESLVGKLPELGGKRMVSNGIFALALMMWLGAEKVILSGFSFDSGHSSITPDLAQSSPVTVDLGRRHVEIDLYFLRKASSLFPHIYATDEDFARQAGLPVWMEPPTS